ncbi:MAG: rod shape-determining protein MreD [Gammaproteobacteria bacterium]|nr:rod shape-determining protein MreD [Gammaproteobacteria bacterium]MBT8095063.1 rod shape-determining protein MreD [Gammaproteobacteria bacterium]NNF50309.1 rod shape-determining protein MreD [Woeseiaceae bacterium]NNL64109.1 rod shape-determining protein MreD [Woeseiaceae bacterium]
MTAANANRRLPVIVTLVVGLMLSIMPLPGLFETLRPDWLTLLVIFWAMQLPRTWSVGTAWIIGIVLDVAYGTLLGQHAVALCVIAFVTVRFHLLMRVFPLSQLTATVFALLALYQFILFWINGVAAVTAPAISYWGPVVTGTLIWPFLYMFLSGIRYRAHSGA